MALTGLRFDVPRRPPEVRGGLPGDPWPRRVWYPGLRGLSAVPALWSPCAAAAAGIMVFYFTSSSGEWARRPPGSFLNTGALSWDPQAVASSAGGASSLALSAPLPSRVPLRQGLGAVKGPFPLRTLRSGVLFPQSQRPPVATWSWVEFVGFSLPTPVCGLYSDCTLVITHFEEERRPASCSASQEVRLTLLGMGRRAWMRQKAVKRPWNGHAATPWTWLMSRSWKVTLMMFLICLWQARERGC